MPATSLDYERRRPLKPDRSMGYFALWLALAGVVLNLLLVLIGNGEGGRGWAFNYPCFLLGLPVNCLLRLLSIAFAIRGLIDLGGRDWMCWLAVILAIAAPATSWALLRWAGQAVVGV